MAFNDLLSSSFLFSIAIIIILIGGIFAYVSYRMSEQDHKMTSMLGLITTMAEELHFFRNKLSKAQGQHVEQDQMEQTRLDHDHVHIILDPNNLVPVPKLISVSDDEDEEEDEDDDTSEDTSENDTSSDDGSVSDGSVSEADIDLEEDVVDLEGGLAVTNIEKIHNIKSIHLEEPINLSYTSQDFKDLDIDMDQDVDHSDEILTCDLKTITISDLEETNKKTDYKKMSLNKLREVVVEKGVVTDASKLKKHDLLKLLGDE